MPFKHLYSVVFAFVFCAYGASLLAAPTFSSGGGTKRAYKPSRGSQGSGASRSLDPNRVKLTIQISGATERQRASITQTLNDSRLKVKFHEATKSDGRLTFSVDTDRHVDLNQFVRAFDAPLGLSSQESLTYELLVFGDFDESDSLGVRVALGRVDGIDASSSTIDAASGVLRVRLTGSGTMTPENIRTAMKATDNKISFKKQAKARAQSPSRLAWLTNYLPSWHSFERTPEPQQSEQQTARSSKGNAAYR